MPQALSPGGDLALYQGYMAHLRASSLLGDLGEKN